MCRFVILWPKILHYHSYYYFIIKQRGSHVKLIKYNAFLLCQTKHKFCSWFWNTCSLNQYFNIYFKNVIIFVECHNICGSSTLRLDRLVPCNHWDPNFSTMLFKTNPHFLISSYLNQYHWWIVQRKLCLEFKHKTWNPRVCMVYQSFKKFTKVF